MADPETTPPLLDRGRLDVGEGHELAYRQVGSLDGTPVVYLHGGPGSGLSPGAGSFVDPDRHRAVLYDQRGAGASTPHAASPDLDWTTIDLDRHLADLERLRIHLGIERWVVHGYSWGSVLGLSYAQTHPERVIGVVVGAVSTGTRDDIDWLTVHSGRFFPAEWEAFRRHVPDRLGHLRLVDAYGQLVHDPDPAIHEPASAAWCRWEDAHVATAPGAIPNPRYRDPVFRLAFARQVTHCWRNDSWLDGRGLVANAPRMAGTPCWLVHGRLDVSSPLDAAWRIHRAWPGSELVLIDDEGHGGRSMKAVCRTALADLVA